MPTRFEEEEWAGAFGARELKARLREPRLDFGLGSQWAEVAYMRADEQALTQAVTAAHEGGAHQATSRLEDPSSLDDRGPWVTEAVQPPEGEKEVDRG